MSDAPAWAPTFFTIAVFAPLLGAAIAGLFGRTIGDRAAQLVTIGLMLVASACAIATVAAEVASGSPTLAVPVSEWVQAGGFHAPWMLRLDALSAEMATMVTCVATLIHVYSVGYMHGDARPSYRFFAFLSLFSFAMLMLVSSDNLVQLFFGWEGVGLVSYLLIGYWYERRNAQAAANKAFVVNRVADLFFMVGIALTFLEFDTVAYDNIFALVPAHSHAAYHLFGTELRAYEVIGVLLFIGASGKSAQLFLHTWLPDAMEGPTPVSALIHAATMVTAGVFLIARMSPLIEFAPVTKDLVAVIGASTCFFAATVGMVQPDIKRTIAYSTCSQLGYMFLACGVGVYQAGMFHLTTHAFFKALLFLAAGSVIHGLGGEQDMRRMGGLARKLPVTCVLMWIGSLALAAVPPFAGWWSKDAILSAAYAAHSGAGFYGWVLGSLTAAITAFYSWRLLFLVFHGAPRDRHLAAHAHESPAVMLVPLLVLAVGAAAGGWLLAPWFVGQRQSGFWNGAIFTGPENGVLAAVEQIPLAVDLVPTVLSLLGIAAAVVAYGLRPQLPAQLARALPGLYRFLLNKWYFDELYERIFAAPYRRLAVRLGLADDAALVEGVPGLMARAAGGSAAQIVRVQTGSIAVYAFTMLIGVVVLVSTFLVFR